MKGFFFCPNQPPASKPFARNDSSYFSGFGPSLVNIPAYQINESDMLTTILLVTAGVACFALFFKAIDYFEKF